MELRAALRRHFGFPDFRPGQEAAIRHVLAGRDALVVMPTGAGKSLIYQLSALLLPGTTLVISPLIALMKDQVDGLTRRGLPATCLHSGLDPSERAARLRALADGRYKIVLVAPERLRAQPFRDAMARVRLSLLAVDEAHCLSQWGHDFRPDYLHLADARLAWGSPVTLALTATATPTVQQEIVHLLGLPAAERLVAGSDRPNLTLEVCSAADTEAKLWLLHNLLRELDGAGLVYVGTRRDADEVAEFVREVARRQARPYHGLMQPAERAAVQDAFLAGELPIVVATNAFGMGIDRPDVRWVLHYDLPGTLEAYYQEAGRAGRDGRPARAVLLYSPRDAALQQFFIDHDAPSLDELRAAHDALRSLPRPRLDDLERATGLPATKARVALEQLELTGAIRRGPDDPSGRFHVELSPLTEAALQTVSAQVEARRAHRRRQLDRMVAYAEATTCRRRLLLDHFGDRAVPEAPRCCDNCLASAEVADDLVLHRRGPRPHARWDRPDRNTLATTAHLLADGMTPQQVAVARGLTLGTIYSHLAALVADGRLTTDAIITPALRKSIRVAIEAVGSTDRLEPIKAALPDAVDYGLLRCEVEARKRERALPDPVAAFLARPHARPLQGPWLAGWALDFHSRFDGNRHRYGAVGNLVLRFKYRGELHLADELAGRWAALLQDQPELPPPDGVVGVPPSILRPSDPVAALAHALAARLGVPARTNLLVKTRATRPQKELTSLAQKRANVAGAFALSGEVRGLHLLLVDDLYDSGATLSEAATVLRRGGAAGLVVLALTRTIHADA